MEDGKMSLKNKIIILVIAIILAAAVFSMVSADTNSLLEFFGFGKPTQTITPTPTAESGSQPKSQKTPAPDTDPFLVTRYPIAPALISPMRSTSTLIS